MNTWFKPITSVATFAVWFNWSCCYSPHHWLMPMYTADNACILFNKCGNQFWTFCLISPGLESTGCKHKAISNVISQHQQLHYWEKNISYVRINLLCINSNCGTVCQGPYLYSSTEQSGTSTKLMPALKW